MAWDEAHGLYNGIEISKLKSPIYNMWGCPSFAWAEPYEYNRWSPLNLTNNF